MCNAILETSKQPSLTPKIFEIFSNQNDVYSPKLYIFSKTQLKCWKDSLVSEVLAIEAWRHEFEFSLTVDKAREDTTHLWFWALKWLRQRIKGVSCQTNWAISRYKNSPVSKIWYIMINKELWSIYRHTHEHICIFRIHVHAQKQHMTK